jgi:hypothetical protein
MLSYQKYLMEFKVGPYPKQSINYLEINDGGAGKMVGEGCLTLILTFN